MQYRLETYQKHVKDGKTYEWNKKNPKPDIMARTFYEFDPEPNCVDAVCCVLCGLKLGQWNSSSEPLLRHCHQNTHCAVAKLADIYRRLKSGGDVQFKEILKVCESTYPPGTQSKASRGLVYAGKRGPKIFYACLSCSCIVSSKPQHVKGCLFNECYSKKIASPKAKAVPRRTRTVPRKTRTTAKTTSKMSIKVAQSAPIGPPEPVEPEIQSDPAETPIPTAQDLEIQVVQTQEIQKQSQEIQKQYPTLEIPQLVARRVHSLALLRQLNQVGSVSLEGYRTLAKQNYHGQDPSSYIKMVQTDVMIIVNIEMMKNQSTVT